MIVPTIKIDDSQFNRFLKSSPRRASWALVEALKAAGGHLRKKIVKHMQAGAGWPPLAKSTVEKKQKHGGRATKYRTHPLELLQRMVRFKFSRRKGQPMVRVGFFNTKSWFKTFYGVGPATIASLHEKGSKSSRHGKRPRREMITPIRDREKHKIPGYVEKKFFKLFFSKKKPGLKY